MHFRETSVAGVYVIELEAAEDERGAFMRTYCREAFLAQGVDFTIAQSSVSMNRRAGTLRGIHFQTPPHEEQKLVRCAQGAMFDVAVDLREDSPTFRQWVGVELSADNQRMLYLPQGCGHGFQTLVDSTVVHYDISPAYVPEAARGVPFDDPAIGIDWPHEVTVMSDRDRSFPPLGDRTTIRT